MEGADGLGLIAEVGIAIAGFAGVVAALRAQGGRIEPFAAWRIGILLSNSTTVVLLALIPIALHYAGLASGTVWTLSSAGMAGVLLLVFFVASPLIYYRRVRPSGAEDPPGTRWWGLFSWPYVVAIFILQVANAASIGQLWPFYVGLVGITALSLFNFAYFLLAPIRSEVQA